MTLITSILWIAQFFYFICFIPQIIDNYKRKSGNAISPLLLLAYLNAYLALLFYVFCMNLPTAYKTMVPLQTLATLTLIGQQVYYGTEASIAKMRYLYIANVILFLLFIPHAQQFPLVIGGVFGWINFAFSIVSLLPQVFKIYREKSVAGFSILFVMFTGTGAILETSGAFIAQLPLQTCLNAMRCLTVCLIFCCQFLLYRE